MEPLHPSLRRTTIAEDGLGGLRITFRPNLGGCACAGLMLMVFALALVAGRARALISDDRAPDGGRTRLALLVLAGTIALIGLAAWWLRQRRVYAAVGGGELSIWSEFAGFRLGRARSFPLSEAYNLRYVPIRPGGVPGMGTGYVAFDYDGRVRFLGEILLEPEARGLVATLKSRFRFPEDRDEPLPISP